jgi:small subunit ribosomal protein S6
MVCMRTYELMFISNGSLDEQAVQAVVDRFTTLIAEQGGNVDKVDHWGKRQFAYEINHMTEGYYTVVDFDISSEGSRGRAPAAARRRGRPPQGRPPGRSHEERAS